MVRAAAAARSSAGSASERVSIGQLQGRCFNCGELGHSARVCTSKPPLVPPESAKASSFGLASERRPTAGTSVGARLPAELAVFFLEISATSRNPEECYLTAVACECRVFRNGALVVEGKFTRSASSEAQSDERSLARGLLEFLRRHTMSAGRCGVLCAHDGRWFVFPAVFAAFRRSECDMPCEIVASVDSRLLLRDAEVLLGEEALCARDALEELFGALFPDDPLPAEQTPTQRNASMLALVCSHEIAREHVVAAVWEALPAYLRCALARSVHPPALGTDLQIAAACVHGGRSERWAEHAVLKRRIRGINASIAVLPPAADDRAGWELHGDLRPAGVGSFGGDCGATTGGDAGTPLSSFMAVWAPVEDTVIESTNWFGARQRAVSLIGAFARWVTARNRQSGDTAVTPSDRAKGAEFRRAASAAESAVRAASDPSTSRAPCVAKFAIPSGWQRWEPLTRQELRRYVGICIAACATGRQNDSASEWWSKDPVGSWALARSAMSLERFTEIESAFCVIDGPVWDSFVEKASKVAVCSPASVACASALDPVASVRPFCELLFSSFNKCFQPFDRLCVTTAAVSLGGIVQAAAQGADAGRVAANGSGMCAEPLDPSSSALRAAVVIDTSTGYTINMSLFGGSVLSDPFYGVRSGDYRADVALGLAGAAAARALDPFLDRHRTVFTDPEFTSTALYDVLRSRRTFATGLADVVRSGLPRALHERSVLSSAPRGGMRRAVRGELAALVWRGRDFIHVLTSASDTTKMVTTQEHHYNGDHVPYAKPEAIEELDRNSIVAPPILASAAKSAAAAQVRAGAGWWTPLAFWLIDIAVQNAAVLWGLDGGREFSDREFRLQLALALARDSGASRATRVKNHVAPLSSPSEHRLVHIGPKERHGSTERRPSLRCFVCSQSRDAERRTVYQCAVCKVPLCDPSKKRDCFHVFHSDLGHWYSEATTKRRRTRKASCAHETSVIDFA